MSKGRYIFSENNNSPVEKIERRTADEIKALWKRIDYLMEKNHKSIYDFARLYGYNAVGLWRAHNSCQDNTQMPIDSSFSTFLDMADYLECPIEYLIHGIGEPNIKKGDNQNNDFLISLCEIGKKDDYVAKIIELWPHLNEKQQEAIKQLVLAYFN